MDTATYDYMFRPFLNAWKEAEQRSIQEDAERYSAHPEQLIDDLALPLGMYGKGLTIKELVVHLEKRLEKLRQKSRNGHYSYSACEHHGLARWKELLTRIDPSVLTAGDKETW